MRTPSLYRAETLRQWDVDEEVIRPNGINYWRPARPIDKSCLFPWWTRFKLAYMVLIGKYDCVVWNFGDKH